MRKMKDSGIEWIGEIPEDWEVRRIKTLFQLRNEKSFKPLNEVNLISLYTDKGVLQHSDIEYVAGNKASNADGYKCVYEEDIVVNIILCWMGAIGRSSYNGVTSPAYDIYKPNVCTNSSFYHYYFRTTGFNGECFQRGRGIMLMRWRTYSEDFMDIKVCYPPLVEQQKIADFLDKKCSEIDSVISKTRETIEEYKKLKQSIITELVTGKVKIENEKVCGKYDIYKDSGIEWIGEIPSEWEVKPIKALFSFGKGLPITKDNLTETGLSVISYGQIHSKNNIGTEIRNELIRYVDKIYYETNPQSLVHKGDFIFADTSEDLEGCGNFVYVNREEVLFAGYHTIILFSKEKNDNKYLAYLFQTDCWRRQIRCCCSGVKLFSISRRILGSTNLILPSILEQQQISDFLDKKCSEIDKLITKKEQLVVELESYKKSLIYEVVTGKRSV